MTHKSILPVISSVIILFYFGCKDYSELDPPSLDPGEITPGVYVAIGNSLTAGYQNNSLYESSQNYSYPKLIAKQLGISVFEQPLIGDPGIPSQMRVASIDPFALSQESPYPVPLNAQLAQPYNNLGIPGATIGDFVDTTDFAVKSAERGNPFFQLVLRNRLFGRSLLEQAVALEPTLITFWLGNNDILGYAVSGGTQIPPTAQNTAIFDTLYNQASNAIASYAAQSNAKVVVANIPDVTVIPFVNTIPPVVIDPQTGAPIINPETEQPFFLVGVLPGDLVLLPAINIIGPDQYGIPEILGGNGTPIPPQYVLTVAQQEFIQGRVNTFNSIIQSAADRHDFALVDINSRFREIHESGYRLGDLLITTDFVTGGIFSLDGIHPTTWGYGIIANEFIETMNREFNANIPAIHVGALPPSIKLSTQGVNKGHPDYYKMLYQMKPVNIQDLIDLYTGL